MPRITVRRARTWRWARMRPWVGRPSRPVSLSPSQSCPGCTINTSGYDFRKGHPGRPGTVVVVRPAHDGGGAVTGERDGEALLGAAHRAAADDLLFVWLSRLV